MSKGGEFRRLLKENDYVYSTGVTGALDASIAERVGLKFVYMSGYSTSLALLAKGRPRLPLLHGDGLPRGPDRRCDYAAGDR